MYMPHSNMYLIRLASYCVSLYKCMLISVEEIYMNISCITKIFTLNNLIITMLIIFCLVNCNVFKMACTAIYLFMYKHNLTQFHVHIRVYI